MRLCWIKKSIHSFKKKATDLSFEIPINLRPNWIINSNFLHQMYALNQIMLFMKLFWVRVHECLHCMKARGFHRDSIEESLSQRSFLSVILWHFTIEMHVMSRLFHQTDVPCRSPSWVVLHMAGSCPPLDHRALCFPTPPDNTGSSGDAVTLEAPLCHVKPPVLQSVQNSALSVKMSGRGPVSERVCPECEWISTLHTSSSARKLKKTFKAK